MKKQYWMPAMLTAAAMSVTAYAQDQAGGPDYETDADTSANVELDAGASAGQSDSAQAESWENSQADTAQAGESGSDQSGLSSDQSGLSSDQSGQAGSEQSGQAQISSTEGGQQKDYKEFSEVDKDGNGLLGIEEARDVLPQHMSLVDTNGDGVLNRDEAEAAMPEVSFTGDNPSEPVGPNDYQTIQDELQSTGGSGAQGGQGGAGEQSQPSDQEAEIDASADLG